MAERTLQRKGMNGVRLWAGHSCQKSMREEGCVCVSWVADLWTLIRWRASCTKVLGVDGSDPEGHQPSQPKITQLCHTRFLHVYHVLHPEERRGESEIPKNQLRYTK
jgi:hypothetical protein